MKYYKFATPEQAKHAASRSGIELYKDPNWLFCLEDYHRDAQIHRTTGLYVGELTEVMDLSQYPSYIICKYKEDYINVPIKYSKTSSIRYESYMADPALRTMDGYNINLSQCKVADLGSDKDWSAPKTKTLHFGGPYLKEQIRARYGFFERPRSGLLNVVVDSYFPGLLYMNDLNVQNLKLVNLPKTAVAISPLVASLLNVKRIPTEQLIRVLGYTEKDIKKIISAVKKKELHFVFAGAGGTGMNTAYFFSELCRITNTVNLFKKISIFEKEKAEMSNLLRFPIDPRLAVASRYGHKVDLMEPLIKTLSRNKIEVYNNYITESYKPYEVYTSKWDNETKKRTVSINENTVVFGAPEIAHRDHLSQAGGFICATHAATSASIWLNPKQSESLQIETYGLIQLGGFFMNQLKMAITTLQMLAESNDLMEQDKEILDFSFDGSIQLPTDRQYNWQLDNNLHMFTDDQLNVI